MSKYDFYIMVYFYLIIYKYTSTPYGLPSKCVSTLSTTLLLEVF